MHPLHRLAPLLAMVLCLGAIASHAGEMAPPGEAKVRSAITKGLVYLGKEGDAWIAKEKCLACHHQPMILWSNLEAMRRGFPADEKQSEAWVHWSATYADPKGGPEALALLLLSKPPVTGSPKVADILRPTTLTKNLLATQRPDGSWRATGRLGTNQHRKPGESHEVVTRLSLLALAGLDAADEKTVRAREQAMAWLKKSAAPETNETLIFRALVVQQSGASDEADALFKDILAQQHPDGGWAWRHDEAKSDAYTTSMALYALHHTPVEHAAEAMAHAQAWLLAAQRDDGAWAVSGSLISNQGPEHLAATSGVYTTWASSWAVLALLQDFPVAK